MVNGTPNEGTTLNGIPVPVKDQFLWYEFWGSDRTFPHFAAGWAWAMSTPFKWMKQVASHFGGTAQGVAMSWPGHINDVGAHPHASFTTSSTSLRRSSKRPAFAAPGALNGIAQRPMDGVSMAYTWDKANATPRRDAPRSISRCSATAPSTTTAGSRRRPRRRFRGN